MNITVFEFLKRFETYDGANFVNLYRDSKLKEKSLVKFGTLKDIKEEYGIEPFNPLAIDKGQEKVKDFKISKGYIYILIE